MGGEVGGNYYGTLRQPLRLFVTRRKSLTLTEMSASAASSTPSSKKAIQTHMIHHLAALAMLLDEDHIEELLLTICRDNDIVGMFYRRDALVTSETEVDPDTFDGSALFETLNTTLWDAGRQVLVNALARNNSIHRIESAMVPSGGCGAVSGGCAVGHKD